jgi:NO-binding membrane sensor protein with MHYT domain/CheY-like chemotaxis protein
MPQHYHHGLVLVSVLVAILASYTALTLALRIRVAARQAAPAWLVGGGLAMGIGIWSMHFVGMLALTLPIDIAYDVWITFLSLVIAIVVSTFALRIASRERVSGPPLFAAGIAMGIGICSMHYVGMAAIEIVPPIRYDPFWVTASFAIAIAASFAALWVAFTSRKDSGGWPWRTAAGAAGMGVAISGMHYVGMLAAQFPADAMTSSYSFVDKAWLAGAVTSITLFVLIAALLLSFIDARAAARAASMQASLAQAKETSRAKDEFLAMLGHELRNPLASISSAVHLLRSAAPRSDDWLFAHEVLGRQSSHLANIVDDLLDVGRAIAGKMSLNLQPLDLHLAVDQALSALGAAGKTAGRHVDYHGSSVWVKADRTRIEQVLSNLVSNAVKQTADGGRIGLRVARSGGEVLLTVSDDGIGMDAETAARAFELFFQADQEPDRKKGGLGIGLTLARRIVEMHGGTLGVASDGPGKGATFSMRLPAIAMPRAAEPSHSLAVSGSGRQVVIVEDSQDTRLSLQKVLESEGHTVHTASDGPSGLDTILHVRPDVALVDIGLPGLDGYRLAQRLRSAGLKTFLVALTGYGLGEDKNRARDAGFDAHLTKPPPMAYLLKLVAEAARST